MAVRAPSSPSSPARAATAGQRHVRCRRAASRTSSRPKRRRSPGGKLVVAVPAETERLEPVDQPVGRRRRHGRLVGHRAAGHPREGQGDARSAWPTRSRRSRAPTSPSGTSPSSRTSSSTTARSSTPTPSSRTWTPPSRPGLTKIAMGPMYDRVEVTGPLRRAGVPEEDLGAVPAGPRRRRLDAGPRACSTTRTPTARSTAACWRRSAPARSSSRSGRRATRSRPPSSTSTGARPMTAVAAPVPGRDRVPADRPDDDSRSGRSRPATSTSSTRPSAESRRAHARTTTRSSGTTTASAPS